MSNDKINKRWQRQNQQPHMSKADRIRAERIAKAVKALQEVEIPKLTRERFFESWDLGDGPSRSVYTSSAPPSHGYKRKVHRLFKMKFQIDPETVEAMRLASARLEKALCERMRIPPHLVDPWQFKKPEPPPKPELTTEVLINGRWVPVQQE